MLLCRVFHYKAFLIRHRHRLLAENMLACGSGCRSDLAVIFCRRGNHNRVNPVILKQFSVIRIICIYLQRSCGFLCRRFHRIRHRSKAAVIHRSPKIPGVNHSRSAGADQCDPHDAALAAALLCHNKCSVLSVLSARQQAAPRGLR